MNAVEEQLMHTSLAQKIDIGIDESDRLWNSRCNVLRRQRATGFVRAANPRT